MTPTIEATIEVVNLEAETQAPEPIRTIRKVNGVYRWVDVLPSELTPDECRAIYVAAFGIYE